MTSDPIQVSINIFSARNQLKRSLLLTPNQGVGGRELHSSLLQHRIDFSGDLLFEILTRLPATSVLRFRAVSKAWNQMILDPIFAKIHIFYQNFQPRSLIIAHSKDTWHLVEVDGQTGGARRVSGLNTENYVGKIIGSCNGILCLWNTGTGWNSADTLCLCNPLFGDCLLLPHPVTSVDVTKICGSTGLIASHGFGFNPSSSEFKVVRVVFPAPNNVDYVGSDVEVCTVSMLGRLSSWRSLGSVPYIPDDVKFTSHAFVSGRLHWLAKSDEYHVIVAFDIQSEKIQLVPLGPIKDMDKSILLSIGEVRGFLSVLSNSFHSWDPSLELWVMKEYGEEHSWTKEFSLRSRTITSDSRLIYKKTLWVPSTYADDKILLQNNDFSVSVLYDPRNTQGEDVNKHGREVSGIDIGKPFTKIESRAYVVAHVASLISLQAGHTL